ncbi:heavy metal translocating P-type ATPase [Chitinispirillum alkaliphilum]|nr:heavy metal translocating P-type ATPase [Chitinispirillum alkaliphilum]
MEQKVRNTEVSEEISLSIEGMSCASCALNLEKALTELNGVKRANVNFASQKAYLKFNPEMVNIAEIIKEVEKSGYGAKNQTESTENTISLKIAGMSCSSCAANLEKMLSETDGVDSATVNFAAETALIVYQPDIIGVAHLQKIVKKAGYRVEETTQQEERQDSGVLVAKNRMVISAILSSVMMSLMMVHMFVGRIPGYLLFTAVIGFPVIFLNGIHVHKAALGAIIKKRPNMDVLVSMGSAPPYLLGLLGFFFPVQTFIEMATTIMTFHLIGKYLETRAKGKASHAIRKLVQMGAKTARVIDDGVEQEVPVAELRVGQVMIVRPGEKIPTDGIVTDGSSLIDESMATGESMPVKRGKGDEVIGATINKQGLLKVKVSKVGSDTFLSQVIKMVEQCQGSKVPIQEFADRVTGYFVPAILALTALTFISFNIFPGFHLAIIEWGAQFLPWVNPDLSVWTLSFITATAVLVIACPCALGLGTPTALMVGSGMGAERGILIRNGEAVQTLRGIKCIAFDKTGTITKGKPELTDVVSENKTSEEILYYAASVEHGSEHPLSFAITEAARERKLHPGEVKEFRSVSGKGVEGIVNGRNVLVGNSKLMDDNGVNCAYLNKELQELEDQAKTAMIIAVEGEVFGIIAVADTIKEESVNSIGELERMGIRTAMITGDNERTASAIARKVGISHVIAGVLPEGKVDEIQRLQKEFGMVAMVGDGINDAPALKQANVGIAIGTGTDIAIEAADVTLVRGELGSIISAIKLSNETFRKIKQNFFYAWLYNSVAIPIAMLGLLHPMIGVAAMSMSSLNVVYNSLGLKKKNISPSYLN